jgi:hypothetical protein
MVLVYTGKEKKNSLSTNEKMKKILIRDKVGPKKSSTYFDVKF